MWNTRYAQDKYVYGEEPNIFFSEQLSKLKTGNLLLPAEGEGRNAVFAAKLGWLVDAFDFSISAKEKALKLADKYGVTINYEVLSILDFKDTKSTYDCIALTYVHLPDKVRNAFYKKLSNLLSSGGTLILEGFSKKQIENDSGGPKDISLLFSIDELKSVFNDLSISFLQEEDIQLNEGDYHKGEASVIRLLATKQF